MGIYAWTYAFYRIIIWTNVYMKENWRKETVDNACRPY